MWHFGPLLPGGAQLLASGGVTPPVPKNVGSTAFAGGGSTTITVTLPTHVAGDFLLVVLGGYDSPNYRLASPPAGWTEIVDAAQGGAGGADYNGISVYWKFAESGSETDPQFTFTSATGDRHSGVALSFTGVNTTSPIGSIGAVNSSDGSGTAPATHTSPGITPIGSASLGLYLDHAYYGEGNGVDYELSTPSGWTEWYDKPYESSSTDEQHSGGYKNLTQGVSSGNISVNGGPYWAQVQIELRAEGDTAVSSAGYIKVWTGSSWELKPVKVWTGTSWVTKPLKYWNGTSWTTT